MAIATPTQLVRSKPRTRMPSAVPASRPNAARSRRSSSAAQVGKPDPGSLGGWLGCLPKFVNKSCEVAVLRRNGSEPLRVDKRGCNISVGAVECNQRGKDPTIVWMVPQNFIQYRHGFRRAAARMQRNGINVGVMRVVGLEHSGCLEFGERFSRPFESRQREAERMSHGGVTWGDRKCRAQYAFAFAVTA